MIKRSTENSAKMSKPDTGDDSSLHEDALLSEEPDVLIDETTKGSENVTVSILIDFPVILPGKEDTLYLPAQPQLLHPLHKKLQLLVCHLSGITSRAEEFRLALHRSSCNPGEQAHKSSMTLTTKDGECSVVQGVLIPFQLL